MPGGGLYRRVSCAAAAFGEGPDSIIQKKKAEDEPKSKADAGGNNAMGNNTVDDAADPIKSAFCDVRAFSVWYWSDEGSFVPETMYLNAKDAGHTTTEPRLVVSLSSFEALSQAYVRAVEKEGVKAASLAEKEDLLAALRVGYYKELMHLRELLDAAKEQMALSSKRTLDDAEMERMQAFERMVKTTDVHYFNIIDYLEPELKAIMQEAVKSFNRDLMKEIFDLRDRLTLYEGTDSDAGMTERILTMLLGRGLSPAKIVKMLSDMICDKQQSDDFHSELTRLLHLGPRTDFESRGYSRRPRPSKSDSGGDKGDDDDGAYGRGRGGGRDTITHLENLSDEALLDEARKMKEEINRLKAEIKKLMKQLQEAQQALITMKEQFARDLAAAIEKAKQEMIMKNKQNNRRASQERAGAGAGTDAGGQERAAGNGAGGGSFTAGGGSFAAGGSGYSGQGGIDPDSASLRAALDDARRRQEEADRRIAELLQKLRDAEALIARLKAGHTDSGGGNFLPQACEKCGAKLECATCDVSPDRGIGNRSSLDDSRRERPSFSGRTPSGMPRRESQGGGEGGYSEEGDDIDPFDKRKRRIPLASESLDRTGVDRSGNYSALTGKPMMLIEDELRHERELRIKYECKNRDLEAEIDDFKVFKKRKEREIAYLKRDLEVTTEKLTKLIERDENDGVEDVQVFCNWLLKKYGSLDNGFRALDDDGSGTMSLTEFIGGLKQMGWLKIVGKRLYKLFDHQNTGQFTLSQLHEVYDKWVNGKENTDQTNELDAADKEEAREKQQAQVMKDMRSKAKKLEDEKLVLEEEIVRLQRKLKREDIAKEATVDGRDMKAMERKVDSIKSGYESLKQERDEMVSKVTAAMWKCRVAHIAQVKLGREAAVAKEELKKLQNKFEFFKTSMKRQKAFGDHSHFATSPDLSAATHEQQMTRTWAPGAGDTQILRKINVDELTGEASAKEEDALPVARTADGASAGGAAIRCPKCQACFRVSTDSASGSPHSPKIMSAQNTLSPTSMRAILENAVSSTPASGDEAGGGGARPQASPDAGSRKTEKRLTFGLSEGSWAADLSPEDLIGKMSDDELLFGGGLNGSAPGGGRAGFLPGDEVEAGLHKGASSSYLSKVQALGGGRHRRWQALFADASERNRSRDPQPAPANEKNEVPSGIMVSPQSQTLIQHARQVSNTLWREAVPLNQVMPGQQQGRLPESEAGPESGAGLGAVSVSGVSMNGEALKSTGLPRRSPALAGASKSMSTTAKKSQSAHLDRSDFSQGHRMLERGKQDASDISHLTSSPAISSFSAARQGLQQLSGSSGQGKIRQGLGLTRTSSSPGLSPLEQHLALRKAKFSPPATEELAPPLLIVGNADGGSEDPTGSSPAAIAAAATPQQRVRTAPSRFVSDASGTLRETRTPDRALGANGISPFSEDDEPEMKTMASKGTLAQPQGMWMRHTQMRRKQGTGETSDDHEDLGSGLPQQPPPKSTSTQKALSSSGSLRQQSMTKQLPFTKAVKRGVDAVLNGCMSMPELRFALARPGNVVRTPPLASSEEKASALARTAPLPSNDEKVGASKKKQQSTSDTEGQGDNSEAASFETPLLYIGKPPPGLPAREATRREPFAALQGAGHAIPTTPPVATSLRVGLARAATVFELGSHVQAHAQADGEEEPLSPSSIQQDLASTITLSSYKELQAQNRSGND